MRHLIESMGINIYSISQCLMNLLPQEHMVIYVIDIGEFVISITMVHANMNVLPETSQLTCT